MKIAMLAVAVMPASPKWTDGHAAPATVELAADRPAVAAPAPTVAARDEARGDNAG